MSASISICVSSQLIVALILVTTEETAPAVDAHVLPVSLEVPVMVVSKYSHQIFLETTDVNVGFFVKFNHSCRVEILSHHRTINDDVSPLGDHVQYIRLIYACV